MRRLLVPALLLVAALAAAGCDVTGSAEQPPEYVVEGYLVAGSGWRSVRVSRTASVQETYSFSELAVSGADVQVEKLNADGDVTATYPYRDRRPGVYVPEDPDAPVEPLGTYRLRVEIPSEAGGPHTITSTTTVPDTFRVTRASADTATYQGEEQVRLTVTRSQYPGRQSKFVFSTRALTPPALTKRRLTPFVREVIGDTADVNLRDIQQNSSPIVNESNYIQNDDGTVTISVPWIVFTFYGPNRLSARVPDDNMYDYLRSYSAQQGGPTLAPGEIPNVIDNVEGGTGVFGSYARVSSFLMLRRADSASAPSAPRDASRVP
jgi:hypothetical protein